MNGIRGDEESISNGTMIRKVLRILLPIYVIRVSLIQEMRCTSRNEMYI